ncbi:FYVE RhoGEF and PH domain-containing protein 1, partial [Biomphalaria pfeifferi]
EGTLDQLLSSLGKRVKRNNSAHPDGYIVYTRHRTRSGAPTINRWSYGEEELRRFE